MEKLLVKAPQKPLSGHIQLPGSKSISNRVLIMRALAEASTEIHNLSISDDTVILQKMLEGSGPEYNAGHAGTSFRFSTAYFAVKPGVQILTGSERMLKRPIGPLVAALQNIGADISYLGEQGYPPLKIGEFRNQKMSEIDIDSSMSSQYISALCMVAPILSKGLKLNLQGRTVSRPYLDMTLSIMKDFGIDCIENKNSIRIEPQQYHLNDYTVESDWSAASYYYSLVALSENSKISLSTLYQKSLQGDAQMDAFASAFGVDTHFEEGRVILQNRSTFNDHLTIDFLKIPDIAQTFAVTAAMKGIHLILKNLDTLVIKETNRIEALKTELSKCGVEFKQIQGFDYKVQGIIKDTKPVFSTYDDHRMAMALVAIAMKNDIIIEDPKVVSKSYPGFWQDLESLGFILDLQ